MYLKILSAESQPGRKEGRKEGRKGGRGDYITINMIHGSLTQCGLVMPCGIMKLGHQVDGIVKDCSNSIANALELLQSCTKPWKFR